MLTSIVNGIFVLLLRLLVLALFDPGFKISLQVVVKNELLYERALSIPPDV